MTKFYNTIAETGYDGLFASTTPEPDVFSVTLVHGGAKKTYARGTILTKSVALIGIEIDDEVPIPVETTGEVAYAILADDVEVGTIDDVVATAYRTGHFVRQLVKNADGTDVTAEQEDDLRKYGILLSDAASA